MNPWLIVAREAFRSLWRTPCGQITGRTMSVLLGRPYWGKMGDRDG